MAKIKGKFTKNSMELETPECNHHHCFKTISGKHWWISAQIVDEHWILGIIKVVKKRFGYTRCLACGMIRK